MYPGLAGSGTVSVVPKSLNCVWNSRDDAHWKKRGCMKIKNSATPMLIHPSTPAPGGTSPAAFSLPPAPPKVSLAPQELQNFDAGASGAPPLGHHALACTNGTGAAS